jgi:septal ring factor EnvC (AmiA/AmiB activator)
MLQKKSLTGQPVSRYKAFSLEFESLIGPLLVFCVCYCHHLYFATHLVSSVFILMSLLSLVCVHAFGKGGLVASALFQLGFLLWTACSAGDFFEQAAFSTSLLIALYASFANVSPVEEKVDTKEVDDQLSTQKQQLWQQLFDARQEITTLYQQKAEKESLQVELAAVCDKLKLMEHQLEAADLYKEELVQEKSTADEEIAKLLSHMREMAERQQVTVVPRCEKLEPFEAKYLQLKEQFANKSGTLDQTRKELFSACEEIEVLKRELAEKEMQPATDEEKRLRLAVAEADQKIESYEEELSQYESMMQELYARLEGKE